MDIDLGLVVGDLLPVQCDATLLDDAADVAMCMTFGPNVLQRFRVWADEVQPVAA